MLVFGVAVDGLASVGIVVTIVFMFGVCVERRALARSGILEYIVFSRMQVALAWKRIGLGRSVEDDLDEAPPPSTHPRLKRSEESWVSLAW